MEELFKKNYEHYINHKKICVIIYFISYIATERGFQDPLWALFGLIHIIFYKHFW